MCSTPKGSGLKTRITPIDYTKPDDSDYTNMLRRASKHYTARQQVRREGEADQPDEQNDA